MGLNYRSSRFPEVSGIPIEFTYVIQELLWSPFIMQHVTIEEVKSEQVESVRYLSGE